MLNAKNNKILIDDVETSYISFGSGNKPLILIPGLADGIKTVEGAALPFAWLYRVFAKDFTVYVVSRKDVLQEGYSTRDMASDLSKFMDQLSIEKASVVGISQGGMIAQFLAIDYPEKVDKLALVVTMARSNNIIEDAVNTWMEMARKGEYRELLRDSMERGSDPKIYKRRKILFKFVPKESSKFNKERFLIQAQSCIDHNSYDKLHKIKATTLILGGEVDRVLGGQASYELAEKISSSTLKMYKEHGHALYEEAKDINRVLMDFLKK